MEDNKRQEVLPLSARAQATTSYIDEESATEQSRKLRWKKHIKWVIYTIAIIVFYSMIMSILDKTIFRVRRPNYRLQSITINDLTVSNATASPSFNMQLSTQVTIRNRNYGPYKFGFGYLTFTYKGTRVGDAVINSSNSKSRSSKKMTIMLNITSSGVPRNSNLGSDITSGRLALTSDSKLRGRVELIKVIKKDKEAILNCTMIIVLSKKVVQELNCD